MMSRRALLAAFLCGSFAAATPAAEPLAEQIRRRLTNAPVLRGRFEQRRTLEGFKNPLVSRGDFLVARGQGVLWHTREPFESTMVVTRERLSSRQPDGRIDATLDARDEPALRAVNEMLSALMAADLQALSQRFRLEGELQGQASWRLVLTPRDAALARWLVRVELEGDRHVRVLQLVQAGGDSSLIRFSEHTTANVLASEEAARFD